MFGNLSAKQMCERLCIEYTDEIADKLCELLAPVSDKMVGSIRVGE